MEFTRHRIGEDAPYIDRWLSAKGIQFLDPTEVYAFQKVEQGKEICLRRGEMFVEERFKYFFANLGEITRFFIWLLAVVLIAGGSVVADPKSGLPTGLGIASLALGGSIAALLIFSDSWKRKLESQTPWQRADFLEFRKEYPLEKIKEFTPCHEAHCKSPLLLVKVEYHPSSPVRFLILYDPNHEDPEYYVDCWQKPETEPTPAETPPS